MRISIFINEFKKRKERITTNESIVINCFFLYHSFANYSTFHLRCLPKSPFIFCFVLFINIQKWGKKFNNIMMKSFVFSIQFKKKNYIYIQSILFLPLYILSFWVEILLFFKKYNKRKQRRRRGV
jgi:hypothetical protein